MVLTPEQHRQIAASYENAASDYMVPTQHRKAFARKAELYRMLARIGDKQELLATPPKKQPVSEPHTQNTVAPTMLSQARHLFAWQQRRKQL
jgi:hypothetical protein